MSPNPKDARLVAWLLFVVSLLAIVIYAISWLMGLEPSAFVFLGLVVLVWIAARPFLGDAIPSPPQISTLLTSAALTSATVAKAAKSLNEVGEDEDDDEEFGEGNCCDNDENYDEFDDCKEQ